MLIINVLCLMATSFMLGYFIAKGKIEVKKTLNKEVSERLAKEQEVINQANKELQDKYNQIVTQFYDQFGGGE
jgi:nucleoside 2-deoxyribosyltransferase